MFAPSMVPMMRPLFITNFMLEVPLASVPVEMCSEMSEALGPSHVIVFDFSMASAFLAIDCGPQSKP